MWGAAVSAREGLPKGVPGQWRLRRASRRRGGKPDKHVSLTGILEKYLSLRYCMPTYLRLINFLVSCLILSLVPIFIGKWAGMGSRRSRPGQKMHGQLLKQVPVLPCECCLPIAKINPSPRINSSNFLATHQTTCLPIKSFARG